MGEKAGILIEEEEKEREREGGRFLLDFHLYNMLKRGFSNKVRAF